MNKKAIFTLLCRISGIFALIVYALVIGILFFLNILPVLYLLIGVIITLPLILWLSTATFKKTSNKKRIITSLLAIVVGILGLIIFINLFATANFLAKLNQTSTPYANYSVIAKKQRDFTLIDAKTASLLAEDSSIEAVQTELKKVTNPEIILSKTDSVATDLTNATSQLGIVKDSYLEVLKEADQEFYDSIDVLANFKVAITSRTVESTIDTSKPFVIYISGIDTYGDISSVSRSDVNMLAVVNPRDHKILLVNTPRDYYVQLYGTSGTRDKLTHAGIYGVETSMKTMENLYEVPVDSYVRVNFSSLISLVDTLGGITVYSDYDFKSYVKGSNNLNGTQALEFSRERYSFSEGDRARGKNQQRVIEAIVQKLNDPIAFRRYTSILSNLRSGIETNISGDKIASIVNSQLNNFQSWSCESISVDGTGAMAPTYSMGSLPLYVMEPDPNSLNEAKKRIIEYLK